jgi:4-amino-4-deoxy-L-arabinose transferase-like glycosyltransferase
VIQISIPAIRLGRPRLPQWRVSRDELAVVALLTAAAIVVRVIDLVGVPPGLHGDEAWTGLRAADILRGVDVGPFDKIHGLGQPAGMEYLTAAFVKVFGSSVMTLRLPMALLGAATVPLTYWLARETFDRRTATISAALLAFLAWHVHFSRIALPPASWPFFEVLACVLMVLALRTRTWWLFVVAGAVLGMGIYSYSSYNMFVVAFAAFVVYWLFTQQLGRVRDVLIGIGVTFLVAFLVALPMLQYINDHRNTYFDYPRGISVFRSEPYKNADGPLERLDVVADAGRDFVQRVVFQPEADFSDGVGYDPMLNTPFSILLGLGILIAFWRWKQPGAALSLLVLLIVPWAGILTVGGGIVRRALGVTPFLAILAALPLAELLRRTQDARPALRAGAYAAVAGAVMLVAALDMHSYFTNFPHSDVGHFVYVPELVAASNYMHDHADGETQVLFYSDRWSINYETRRYLAPGLDGFDRSEDFGEYSLDADRTRDVLFVFLGSYRDRLAEVEQMYPDGTPYERKDSKGEVIFAAYALPKVEGALPPTPTRGPETPTPTATPAAGGDTRDARRAQDIAAIQGALAQYFAEHGEFPDNGGGIQTLCTYKEADAGCKLEDFLNPLPQDPAGNSTENGYFYASDGPTYSIYALRESTIFPACDDKPSHLDALPSLLCAHGP